jgi:hypothetical protein
VVGVCGTLPVIAALLTRTSSPPAWSAMSSAAAATLASSVTSSGTPNASAPAVRSFRTAASRRCGSRAPMPTRQPSAPSPAAISYPIPLFAPVTSAHRPALVLAAKAGASSELLSKLLDAYAAEPHAVAVEVVLCGPGQAESMLRDGRVDVALLHRPYDTMSGLDVEDLRTEQQVAVLPAGHPLATRPRLSMAEVEALTDLPLPRVGLETTGATLTAPARGSATIPSCSS